MTELPSRTTAFTGVQYAEVYPEGIEHHYWYVARNAAVSSSIRDIERQENAPVGRMLEIGCGRGFTVAYLRRHGFDCDGVELASVAVPEALSGHLWSETDCFTLPESYRSAVRLILLLDVIEHIEDPVGFLTKIRSAYPNCRWLIISVPARMELWSNFDREYGHYRRYDEAMLRTELAKAGAEMVHGRYRFVLLYPLVYAFVRAAKKRPLNNVTPRPLLLHWLIGRLFQLETWIFPRRFYGTSFFALARFVIPQNRAS